MVQNAPLPHFLVQNAADPAMLRVMTTGKLDSKFFPLLIDVIDQSIFTVNREGHITSFNRAAEKLTGHLADEVIGSRCSEVFQTTLCDTDCPLLKTIQEGQRVIDRQVRIKAKDGRSIPVSVTTATLATDSGEILGGVEVIKDLSHVHHLKRQLDGRYRFADIISKNVIMQRIFELLPLVAQSDSTVLILGASGTGKELVAKAIHHQSDRRDRPFVALNCAAMPETLMESELFGYVKGAFTDARRDKPGRIAQADGGTLFLDEIGDLSVHLQVKLLRFLQERAYEPLGATFTTRADVRILSATHHDLERMVVEGTFRQDLYYRINIMQILLPDLCERSEDIPLLVNHFIKRFRHTTGKAIESMTESALAALMRHPFPGNVRELENIVERAFIICQGPIIDLEHLPLDVVNQLTRPTEPAEVPRSGVVPPSPHRTGATVSWNGVPSPNPPSPLFAAPNRDILNLVEQDTIAATLKRNRGNRSRTARELGIHRSTLLRKLKRYGLV
jgi:PAS domain S-box-containing protein